MRKIKKNKNDAIQHNSKSVCAFNGTSINSLEQIRREKKDGCAAAVVQFIESVLSFSSSLM